MMARFSSSIFLLGLGAALLWMTLTGYRDGELRAGSGLLKPYRRNRDDKGSTFTWRCTSAAEWDCVWGLLALIGMAPPLKWR